MAAWGKKRFKLTLSQKVSKKIRTKLRFSRRGASKHTFTCLPRRGQVQFLTVCLLVQMKVGKISNNVYITHESCLILPYVLIAPKIDCLKICRCLHVPCISQSQPQSQPHIYFKPARTKKAVTLQMRTADERTSSCMFDIMQP